MSLRGCAKLGERSSEWIDTVKSLTLGYTGCGERKSLDVRDIHRSAWDGLAVLEEDETLS